jgi:glutamine amidotransferase
VLRRRMDEGVCLLGICLGLQWLFESSEEAPQVPGLGALPGRCRPLPEWVKCPHMGWDELQVRGSSRLLRGVPVGAFAYFAHSYCAPVIDETAAVCDYGVCHSAAVERDNLFGVQFHPEKSAETGLTVLENFCSC